MVNSAKGLSTDLTTELNNTIVISSFVANGGADPTVAAPYDLLYGSAVGSAVGATASAKLTAAGATTSTFSGGGTRPVTVAAAFGPSANLPNNDLDGDGLPNDWEQLHFNNPTNTLPTADSDRDGFDNLSEYIAGTIPTNGVSFFRIETIKRNIIQWNAVDGRVYDVYSTHDLASPFTLLQGEIAAPIGTYTDAASTGATHKFYHIEVRLQ